MAMFEQGEVRIRYELSGDPDGDPVLLIAPGGMRSTVEFWANMPWNPLASLADTHRLVAMDQRNAGQSWAPVGAGDGWHSYTADQLALMDHLGIDRFHVLGMCIGGPYLMGLMKAAPQRIGAAVMLQPIGLDDNRQAFYDMFDAWATEVGGAHPEADEAAWSSFKANMYGGDFLFNTTRDEVAAITTPILLLMGDDLFHPQSTSRAIAATAPDVTFVERWKDEASLPATDTTIRAFLADHPV